MVKKLERILSELPARERKRVDRRFRELRDEVENLRRLRELADRSQVEIAGALGLKQPSISKIERQTDMFLSTLRGFVEAAGGELELVVRFPNRRPVQLRRLGDLPVRKPRRKGSKARLAA
jgi:DNA-binding XRE family transcriptional regulator